jgi:two-component sensor histidine kinase
MAFIHEQIYKTKDLAKIDFSEYVLTLSTKLIRIYSRDPALITSSIHCKNIFLNVNTAIPTGLIINELITNSLEHAFDENQKGKIFVEIRSDDGIYTLRIGDDGIGFPEDLDFRNTESLGLNLVVNLVNQLDGTIELNRDKGTEFVIRFKMVGS